jgi:hypothetical protein
MTIGGGLAKEGEETVSVAIKLTEGGGGGRWGEVVRTTSETRYSGGLPTNAIGVEGDRGVKGIGTNCILHPGALPGLREVVDLSRGIRVRGGAKERDVTLKVEADSRGDKGAVEGQVEDMASARG